MRSSERPARRRGVVRADHPAEGAVARLGGGEREHLFLLRAGAAGGAMNSAVRSLSRRSPRLSPLLRKPAALPRVGSSASSAEPDRQLVVDLLVEFLRQLDALGLVLPAGFLPQALQVSDASVREALLPVVGERGVWLSRFNPQWTWVTEGSNRLTSEDRQAIQTLVGRSGTSPSGAGPLRTLRPGDADLARGPCSKLSDSASRRTTGSACWKHCRSGSPRPDEPLLEEPAWTTGARTSVGRRRRPCSRKSPVGPGPADARACATQCLR